MESPYPKYSDDYSPSITDSAAMTFKSSEHSSKSSVPDAGTVTKLPERLTKLAHLASKHPSDRDSIIIHQYLDTVESLLDPRAAESRLKDKDAESAVSTTSSNSPPSLTADRRGASDANNDEIRSQLTVLLDEVTALNFELKERRNESFSIYDYYNHKCTVLEQKIAELKDVIQDL